MNVNKTAISQTYRKRWEAMQRERILDATTRVLTAKGGSLTMEKVAETAGIAKGSIYHYFRNKQDLLKELKERALQPLRDQVDAVFEQDLEPIETIQRLFSTQLLYFEKNREFFRILLYDRQDSAARWKRYQDQRYQTVVAKIAAVLDRGIATKVFRPVDSWKIANMLFEAAIALILLRIQSDSPVPVETDIDLIVSTFLNGIAMKP